MSSRNFLNLVLLIVVATLVLVVIYKPGKKVTPVVKLTDLKRSAINKIEISRYGSTKKVVLMKHGETWQMLEPYKVSANTIKVDAVTELAETTANASYPIKAGQDLKQYGLDKPQVTVLLNDKVKLEFGTIEPLKFQRYIREDNTLYLTFDGSFSNLDVPPSEFVDHVMLPELSTIEKLDLPKLSLSPEGHAWKATPPVKDLSNDRVNELFSKWMNAVASEVLPYTPAKVSEQAKVYLKGQAQPLVFDVLYEEHAISFGRADLGLKYKFTEETGTPLLALPPKIDTSLPKANSHSTSATPPLTTSK